MLFKIKIESLIIRLESPIVSLAILFDNIEEVSDIFNFVFILFDNETVSLPILELNIEVVSAVFSFNANPADRSVVDAFKSILELKVAVSDLFNLVFILFD